jgi:hypothetical protein
VVAEPVTLPQVKTHLRLDPDDTSQDDYVKLLIAASLRSAENVTGRQIGTTWPTLDQRDQSVVAAAMLMIISHWFVNREGVGKEIAELPMAVTWLLSPLKVWTV